MRLSAVDTLFSLRVGQERVKLQSRLPDLVRLGGALDLGGGGHQLGAEAAPELWRRFNEDYKGKNATREQMGTAMLVAVAFRRIMTDHAFARQ